MVQNLCHNLRWQIVEPQMSNRAWPSPILKSSNVGRVTDANPQLAEFAWGRRVLIDYTDGRGNDLQATLARLVLSYRFRFAKDGQFPSRMQHFPFAKPMDDLPLVLEPLN